ncbi:hypothetical protein BS297_20190, partial [Rhodococcus erythropolis]
MNARNIFLSWWPKVPTVRFSWLTGQHDRAEGIDQGLRTDESGGRFVVHGQAGHRDGLSGPE